MKLYRMYIYLILSSFKNLLEYEIFNKKKITYIERIKIMLIFHQPFIIIKSFE